jgi:hypothetical protein
MDFMTAIAAKAAGYKPLTRPYYLATEKWMMDNVLSDLRGIEIAIVDSYDRDHKSIWRKPSKK